MSEERTEAWQQAVARLTELYVSKDLEGIEECEAKILEDFGRQGLNEVRIVATSVMTKRELEESLKDTFLIPRLLMKIAGDVRSASAARSLGGLATEIEERGVCPWCAALLSREGSCPNPGCDHVQKSGHSYFREWET